MARGSNGYWLARDHQWHATMFAVGLQTVLLELMVNGSNRPTDLARALNEMGILTREGKTWTCTGVVRVLKRLGPSFASEVKAARADGFKVFL